MSSADTNAGSGTLYINSGHLDQILVTRIGAPEGKYFIGYRPNADDGKIFTYTAKPLSFGETHNVKYVFNKDASAPSGYRMAIYIDGEFITETDCSYRVDTSSEHSVPAGDLTSWPGSATSFGTLVREAQIMIRTFSQCLADVEFDNFVITCIPTAAN